MTEPISPEAQGRQALVTIARLLVLSPSISIPARTNLAMLPNVLSDVPDGLAPEIEVLEGLTSAKAM